MNTSLIVVFVVFGTFIIAPTVTADCARFCDPSPCAGYVCVSQPNLTCRNRNCSCIRSWSNGARNIPCLKEQRID
ncbi:hypothetical protein DPMN_077026 [Dreissena polymorpha]|uniref:Uncharacterized protein n=1 Tax=Dreissena polymorpha TaxID=45954 RepID=A0A9D3YP70_DREPO|nr:hypothetical protein DPMN_077026 [Dreissena polymorpha]